MSDTLTRAQGKFLAALLSCTTITEAAAAARISRDTAYRWMALAPFDEAYKAARKQMVDHAITRLQAATEEAVTVLCQQLTHPSEGAWATLGAARVILDMAVRAVAYEDLVLRVQRLERRAKERSAPRADHSNPAVRRIS